MLKRALAPKKNNTQANDSSAIIPECCVMNKLCILKSDHGHKFANKPNIVMGR
jgi:hypothetical protein